MNKIKLIYDFFRLWIKWRDRKEAWEDAKFINDKGIQKELKEMDEELRSPLKEMDEELRSPYCPICEACGEDGCCPATSCKQHPDGDYCKGYLAELKFTYWMYKDLMNLVADDPKYKDAIDKMWGENWDAIFKRDEEESKIEEPTETLFPEKLAKANETLERTKESLDKITNKNG
jgi:hypothetical protein